MKRYLQKKLLLIINLFLITAIGYSQSVPQGINYQGLAKDASNNPVMNQLIGVKIGIISGTSSGVLQWEETHSITTNQFGLFTLTIGQGTTTGNGALANFNLIDWGGANHYLKTSMDISGGTSYVAMDTAQLLSVPYALYSLKSASVNNPVFINDVIDVDTSGTLIGKTLKWNGTLWVPANDNNSDTALFAFNANFANTSDTALYTLNATPSDTAIFSFTSDSSNYSATSGSSLTSINSTYSDTATYALNCSSLTNDWHLVGNTAVATDFIGTTNSTDFIVKTNNQERMRITSGGKIGVGTSTPLSSVHFKGDDGFISEGTFGSGSTINLGAGNYMFWYPKKAAFRAGLVSGTQWADASVGNYSFATGNSTRAAGVASVAMGQGSFANDSCGVAIGWNCGAYKKYSVAMGNNSNTNGVCGVAIGRACNAYGFAATAIGYHGLAAGDYSSTFGYYCEADGDFSTAMGTEAYDSLHSGCFIFADNTKYTTTSLPESHNTANNQFMVKASGGTIFYTDPFLTMGVTLAPNSGAWASISDRNKKENFKSIDGESILSKISKIEITSWNYKTQSPSIRHIGPMAQDFYAAFKIGESDTTITSSDIDGINLIAVQTLAKRTKELKTKSEEVEQLKKQIAKLQSEKTNFEQRLFLIETKLNLQSSTVSTGSKK